MKRLLLLTALCSMTMAISAQDLSLWRVYGDAHDHDAHHETVFIPCGEGYYLYGEEAGTTKTSWWSIKNEGDQNLQLDLPLTLADGSSDKLTISHQPTSSTLEPGEETLFAIDYQVTPGEDLAYLEISSNDPNNAMCGMRLAAGFSPCSVIDQPEARSEKEPVASKALDGCETGCTYVVCDNGVVREQCDEFDVRIINTIVIDGKNVPNGSPIRLGPNGQSLEDLGLTAGAQCMPIEISDPCNCDNLVEIDGEMVFRDVLFINSPTPFFNVINNNQGDGSFQIAALNGSLMDLDNLFLLDDDPLTPNFQFTFYRAPGSSVDIFVNGNPFTSDCIEASVCDTIPTMSQWMLFILGLLMAAMAVIMIKVKGYHKA